MKKNEVIFYEFRKFGGQWKDIAHAEQILLPTLFARLQLELPNDSITYCLYDNAIAFVKYRNCWSNLRIYVKYH